MTELLPLPPIQPLKRLQVKDEVLINAERWQVAHDYHHQRQNVHYQSVNQPGIVCGLGVRIIEPTDEFSDDRYKEYKDGRGIQIQAGIAIDLYGNIIVVKNPIEYHINSKVKPEEESRMVYVVLSYPDPKELGKFRNNGQEYNPIVEETFRILEKTDEDPVSDNEVEVCRIRLKQPQESQDKKIKLETPNEVFHPGDNQLDLRYRIHVGAKPRAFVKLATIQGEEDSPSRLALANLRSLASLYPALQVAALQEKDFVNISNYDLIYLKEQQAENFNDSEVQDIKKYLNTGGVVLIEKPIKTTVKKHIITKQHLQKAIAKIRDIESSDNSELATLAEIRPNLEADLKTIQNSLNEEINREQNYFAQWVETPLKNWEDLKLNHPLRTEPFLFAALPSIEGKPIQILTGEGVVIIIGDLSSAWGFNPKLDLQRETIRTAQEMAINILHFAWRRRQMSQLLGNSKE